MTRSIRRSLQDLYTPKLTFMNYSTNIHIQIFKHFAVCIWLPCHLVPRLRIRGDAVLHSLLAFMACTRKIVLFLLTSALIPHNLIYLFIYLFIYFVLFDGALL